MIFIENPSLSRQKSLMEILQLKMVSLFDVQTLTVRYVFITFHIYITDTKYFHSFRHFPSGDTNIANSMRENFDKRKIVL